LRVPATGTAKIRDVTPSPPPARGLPPRLAYPILAVVAVLFLGLMGYFLKIGFGTAGAAFGSDAKPHEQGDARIAVTAAPAPTDPPGTVDMPQSGTGPEAGADQTTAQQPAAQPGSALPPGAGDATAQQGGAGAQTGGPPAPVLQMLTALKGRLATNPNDLGALVTLANMYSDVSKFDQAAVYYKRAIALDPANPDTRTDYAVALHGTGHDLEALAELDAVLKAQPNFPQAYFNRGVIAQAIGRRTEAEGAFKKFLAIAPHDRHAADAKAALAALGG
jgi:hypothetical protein